jgi:hypothetical protein
MLRRNIYALSVLRTTFFGGCYVDISQLQLLGSIPSAIVLDKFKC